MVDLYSILFSALICGPPPFVVSVDPQVLQEQQNVVNQLLADNPSTDPREAVRLGFVCYKKEISKYSVPIMPISEERARDLAIGLLKKIGVDGKSIFISRIDKTIAFDKYNPKPTAESYKIYFGMKINNIAVLGEDAQAEIQVGSDGNIYRLKLRMGTPCFDDVCIMSHLSKLKKEDYNYDSTVVEDPEFEYYYLNKLLDFSVPIKRKKSDLQ